MARVPETGPAIPVEGGTPAVSLSDESIRRWVPGVSGPVVYVLDEAGFPFFYRGGASATPLERAQTEPGTNIAIWVALDLGGDSTVDLSGYVQRAELAAGSLVVAAGTF